MALFGKHVEMVTAAQALPGRADPIPVPDRHEVLGTPMVPPFPDGIETLVVGMGCFWGAEKFFWQADGIYTTAVGYAGGFTPNPTYEEVCSGRTGHAEVALVAYDVAATSLDSLFKVFWENHDPTTPNRQGNDVGTQYRSCIYWTTPEQRAVAVASTQSYQAALGEAGYGEIATEIAKAGEFYFAEAYHQQYLHKVPHGYCNHGFCQVAYGG